MSQAGLEKRSWGGAPPFAAGFGLPLAGIREKAEPVQPAASNCLLERCVTVLSGSPARLVLVDGEDARSVAAALRLKSEALAKPVLLGRPLAVRTLIQAEMLRHPDRCVPLEIADPASDGVLAENTANYMELLKSQGRDIDKEEAARYMRSAPAAGAMMVRRGEVEVGIGGNVTTTADMLRAGLRVLGMAPGGKTVSGFFFMVAPEARDEYGRIFVFADGGVIPEPTVDQLVDIAVDSARQYQRMTGDEPRVAMLSFSSHGSAKHPRAEFVRETVERIRQKAPGLVVDGELQFDAAVVPSVADQKVPGSPLGGRANVLIFPSLEAGNISYKITQRLGGYTAIGPLLQGLAGGWHDLSRGCSADDVYQVALIGAALQRM